MKFDFNQPPILPATIEESHKLIAAIWEEARHLKEKYNTNSANSSKPPSTDMVPPNKKRKQRRKSRSKNKIGAQPGHKGSTRELLPPERVDSTVVCLPPTVCKCGCEITAKPSSFKRHQVYELPPIRPIVTEYQQVFGMCNGCGNHYFGDLPAGVSNIMLGPRTIATVGILSGEYRMTKRLKVKLFSDFFSIPLCVGTMSNAEKIASAALEQPVAEAHEFVKEQDSAHCDETSHKRSGGKMWMWVAIAALVAVFMIRSKRDTASAHALLGENFRGVVISDRYSAYNWLDITRRQLCWAHLKRDFTKISERSGEAGRIGDHLLACTSRLFRLWHMCRDGILSRSQFSKSTEPIIAMTERLLEQGANCEESKTAGTCKQLLKQKTAMWTFIEIEGIQPTNNLAEQVIRYYVMWRKLSYGTQSERGDRFVERVLTVTATCRLQNRDSLEYMTAAVNAYLKGESAPSLLPEQEQLVPVKQVA